MKEIKGTVKFHFESEEVKKIFFIIIFYYIFYTYNFAHLSIVD